MSTLPTPNERHACISRRHLLILGGSAISVLGVLAADGTLAQTPTKPLLKPSLQPTLVKSSYIPQKLASLSQLRPKTPMEFTYPNGDVTNVLIRLGERAGGGVGPREDIVAFNTVCPHMGGPIGADTYKATHNVLGPCVLHLSTFDLTKHGMLVSGHSSDSLPQITLEVRGEDIYAVGVMGLIYGYNRNPVSA